MHDDTGARYNIEMQVRREGPWPERITYYLAKAYVSQLSRGERFETLRPTVSIYLMGFDFFDDPARAHWRFEIRERDWPELRLTDSLQWNLIELARYERLLPAPGNGTSPLTAWITFFQHGQDEAIMKTITHPPVQQALDELELLTDSEEDRHNAWLRERALHDEATFIGAAREEGSLMKAREIARRLIAQLGLDNATIARVTELSEAEVQRLRQSPRVTHEPPAHDEPA